MADMLTRERLEWHIAAATEKLAEGGGEIVAELLEVYRLALVGMAVQPRLISKAPKDGTRILGLVDGHWEECWWYEHPRDGGYWMNEPDSEPDPTHFIPLSSLQEPK